MGRNIRPLEPRTPTTSPHHRRPSNQPVNASGRNMGVAIDWDRFAPARAMMGGLVRSQFPRHCPPFLKLAAPSGHGCGDTGGHVHAGQGCGHHGHIPQRDPRDARVADLLCCGAAARGRVDGRRHAGAGAGRGRRRKGDHVALLRRDEARLGGPHQAVHRRCGNDHGLRRDAGKRLHDGPRGLWPRTRLAAFAGRRWDLHGLRNGRLLFRALPEDLPREERLCRIGWLARRPRLPPCRRRPILDAPRLPDSSFSGAFFLPLSMFVAYIALLLYYIQFRSTNLYDIFPFLRPIRSLLGRGDHGKDKAGVNIGVFGLAAGAGAKANGKPASAPVPSGNLNTSAEYASLLNQHLVTICTGFMFGYGLVFSGMGDTERVQAFLDPLGFGGKWDITLMFVMGSSVMTNLLAYHALRDSNLDVQILHTPEGRPIPLKEVVQWGPVGGNMNINRDLVLGSVMFGLGWGALGVCPGPGIVSFATAQYPTTLAVPFIGLGALLRTFVARQNGQNDV
ncbi:hypothetical protein DFJ74DRAFT_312803 [Hyaloraphidium curvatum]|nr:hypothetical protein DFJ74DRAFT_312803 [Hyaloraphidium curvatum]